MTTTTAVEDRLPIMINIDGLQELWGLKRTATRARTKEETFPAPVVLSPGCHRWWRHEVLEWMESRRQVRKPITASRKASPAADVNLPLPAPVVKRRRAGIHGEDA